MDDGRLLSLREQDVDGLSLVSAVSCCMADFLSGLKGLFIRVM